MFGFAGVFFAAKGVADRTLEIAACGASGGIFGLCVANGFTRVLRRRAIQIPDVVNVYFAKALRIGLATTLVSAGLFNVMGWAGLLCPSFRLLTSNLCILTYCAGGFLILKYDSTEWLGGFMEQAGSLNRFLSNSMAAIALFSGLLFLCVTWMHTGMCG